MKYKITYAWHILFSEKEEDGVAPHFVIPIKPKIVEEGKPAELECTVTGMPVPEIKWYRGDEEITVEQTENIVFDAETGRMCFAIEHALPEDEGIYRVRATNKFGKAECRANLLVQSATVISQPEILKAPKITKPLPALIAEIGTPLVLEVEYQTETKPVEVKWFKNNVEIIPTPSQQIDVDDNTTKLAFSKSKKEDSGRYEVRIKNRAGEARSSASVTTKRPEEISKQHEAIAPRFINPIQPQLVCEGEVVIMESLVESYPTASFQWFFENRALEASFFFYFQ